MMLVPQLNLLPISMKGNFRELSFPIPEIPAQCHVKYSAQEKDGNMRAMVTARRASPWGCPMGSLKVELKAKEAEDAGAQGQQQQTSQNPQCPASWVSRTHSGMHLPRRRQVETSAELLPSHHAH
jgi:hypothetical protein